MTLEERKLDLRRRQLAARQAQAKDTPKTNMLEQSMSGVNTGIGNSLGLPVDAVTDAINGVGTLMGRDAPLIENPVGGSKWFNEGVLKPTISEIEPQTAWQRAGRRVGEEVGASAAMAPIGLASTAVRAAPAAFAATETASALGSGIGAAAANEVAPNSKTAEIVGQLLGGLTAGRTVGRQFDTKPIDQLRANDVSGDDLFAQAKGLYDDAARNGVTANQQGTQGLADDIRSIAASEGLITPAGRIAQSYPKINDAINMVDDFAAGQMDAGQMQTVRRTFQNAAKSADPGEARVGTIMLKKFDDFVEPLAPEFKKANKLYRRASLGDVTDTANELAEARSGQFSGSGFENARRTEYRALDRNIIKGKMKGLTPDQEAAIKKVSRGGVLENTARGLGRAAPTGVVSAGLGGGVPFLIGNAVGGPAVGTAAGVGTMAAGAGARNIATRMGGKNAEIAEMLMRSADGVMPKGSKSDMDKIAAMLLALRTQSGQQ